MLDAVQRQPWRTWSWCVLGADGSRRWRRGHWSIDGATTTTTTANSHPKSATPSPSPAFTGLAFTEKVAEGVQEFGVDVVVVERNPHVDGTVDNQEDEIDDENRRRYVAQWRHGTVGSSLFWISPAFFWTPSREHRLRVSGADNVFCV